jgi:hypothetical protein
MIRTLIGGAALVTVAGLLSAQTPQGPNAHASDTAKGKVAEHGHHPVAKHHRGSVDRNPNAATPAVHATRATPATPAHGEGPATPATPAKPATPAVPSAGHGSSGTGSGNGHRP